MLLVVTRLIGQCASTFELRLQAAALGGLVMIAERHRLLFFFFFQLSQGT